MRKLTDSEYDAFVSAMKGEPHSRNLFTNATKTLRIAAGVVERFTVVEYPDKKIPITLREWRKDQQWSLNLVDRYQLACDAARREFVQVMTL